MAFGRGIGAGLSSAMSKVKDAVMKSKSAASKGSGGGSEAASLENEAARQDLKGFEKAEGFFATPYFLFVDIGGVKFRGADKDLISMMVEEDFIGNDFPVRILTIKCRDEKFHRMLNTEKVDVGKMKGLYKVMINYDMQLNKGNSNEPFLPGMYRGFLIETETTTEEGKENESKTTQLEEYKAHYKTFSMYIYQTSELTFNTRFPKNTHIPLNATPMDIFVKLFSEYNPDMKCVVSPFENNNPIKTFPPIANLPFLDVVDLLDKELGFYRTRYFYYIYRGLFCFMNTDTNHNIIVEEYNNTFTIYPIRSEHDFKGYKIVQISDRSFGVTIKAEDIKIQTDVGLSFTKTEVFVNASSQILNTNYDASREQDTTKKVTDEETIPKDGNIRYETIEFTVEGFVDDKFSPFTVIIYPDSQLGRREYRLMGVKTVITSGDYSYTRLKGFRLQEEGGGTVLEGGESSAGAAGGASSPSAKSSAKSAGNAKNASKALKSNLKSGGKGKGSSKPFKSPKLNGLIQDDLKGS